MQDFSVLWTGKYYQYWQNELHSHSYYQIIAVQKGGGEILLGNQRFPLMEHQVILIHPHIAHGVLLDENGSGPQLMDVKFSVTGDQFSRDLLQLEPVLKIRNFSKFQSYFEDILRESAEERPYKINSICYRFGLLLVMLLREQLEPAKPRQEFVPQTFPAAQCGGVNMANVLAFIQQNYASPITLDELAHVANVSKSTLIQAFKLTLDTTPIKYTNHIRLTKAKDLLLNTDSNIGEIAEMVGFQSLHYFSRYFKNRENISPQEFRQRYSSSHFYTYRQPNDPDEIGLL